MPSDPDHETVEQLIERVTVDACSDEGPLNTSFLCAFEDEVEYRSPPHSPGSTFRWTTLTTTATQHAVSAGQSSTTPDNIA